MEARAVTALAFLLVLLAFVQSCATRSCDLESLDRLVPHCGSNPCPPGNPSEGPGSSVYAHAAVDVFPLKKGLFDSHRSVIYAPASPSPKTAPVVLFLHGYFDADPEPYEAMLRHFARKGFLVIYPSYGNALNPKAWPENAEAAMRRALQFLQGDGHVHPDLDQVAYVGHSIGGMLALHLAQKQALTASPAIPQPKLIVSMDGAGISTLANPYVSIDDLSKIPNSTRLLLIMAEESYQARLKDKNHCGSDEKDPDMYCNVFSVNRLAYVRTPQIPRQQKTALLIPSDFRGEVGLRSEHNGAQGECGSGKPIDAIDTWGYWKYTVGALNQVFRNEPSDYAFLNSESNRSSGVWSDGQQARPALSLDACLESGNCPQPR